MFLFKYLWAAKESVHEAGSGIIIIRPAVKRGNGQQLECFNYGGSGSYRLKLPEYISPHRKEKKRVNLTAGPHLERTRTGARSFPGKMRRKTIFQKYL